MYQNTISLNDIEAETRLDACYGRVGSGKKINDKAARRGAARRKVLARHRHLGIASFLGLVKSKCAIKFLYPGIIIISRHLSSS